MTGRLLLGNPQATEPWQDSEVWEMISKRPRAGSPSYRKSRHDEPFAVCAMMSAEIDGIIAIVSVIRPGAANEGKKLAFTRRYQGFEPVVYHAPVAGIVSAEHAWLGGL